MVVQCVDRNGVSHVIEQYFAFLSTKRKVQFATWVKFQTSYGLPLYGLREHKVVSLFTRVEVPEFRISADSTDCEHRQLRTVIDAVQFMVL